MPTPSSSDSPNPKLPQSSIPCSRTSSLNPLQLRPSFRINLSHNDRPSHRAAGPSFIEFLEADSSRDDEFYEGTSEIFVAGFLGLVVIATSPMSLNCSSRNCEYFTAPEPSN